MATSFAAEVRAILERHRQQELSEPSSSKAGSPTPGSRANSIAQQRLRTTAPASPGTSTRPQWPPSRLRPERKYVDFNELAEDNRAVLPSERIRPEDLMNAGSILTDLQQLKTYLLTDDGIEDARALLSEMRADPVKKKLVYLMEQALYLHVRPENAHFGWGARKLQETPQALRSITLKVDGKEPNILQHFINAYRSVMPKTSLNATPKDLYDFEGAFATPLKGFAEGAIAENQRVFETLQRCSQKAGTEDFEAEFTSLPTNVQNVLKYHVWSALGRPEGNPDFGGDKIRETKGEILRNIQCDGHNLLSSVKNAWRVMPRCRIQIEALNKTRDLAQKLFSTPDIDLVRTQPRTKTYADDLNSAISTFKKAKETLREIDTIFTQDPLVKQPDNIEALYRRLLPELKASSQETYNHLLALIAFEELAYPGDLSYGEKRVRDDISILGRLVDAGSGKRITEVMQTFIQDQVDLMNAQKTLLTVQQFLYTNFGSNQAAPNPNIPEWARKHAIHLIEETLDKPGSNPTLEFFLPSIARFFETERDLNTCGAFISHMLKGIGDSCSVNVDNVAGQYEFTLDFATQRRRLQEAYEAKAGSMRAPSTPDAVSPTRFDADRDIAEELDKKARLLFVSAEIKKIEASGGLGAAAQEMATNLQQAGHKVSIMIPYYKRALKDGSHDIRDVSLRTQVQKIKEDKEQAKSDGKLTEVSFDFMGKEVKANIYEVELDLGAGKAQKILLVEDAEEGSGRNLFDLDGGGLYDRHVPKGKQEAQARFLFYSLATAEYIKAKGKYDAKENPTGFDNAVFHDWHGAFAVERLVHKYRTDYLEGALPATNVITHNLGEGAQGRFYHGVVGDILGSTGIHMEPREFTSSMRAALSDPTAHWSTVSTTYAREIQAHEGKGMDGEMRRLAQTGRLTGIVNGTDALSWRPYGEGGNAKQLQNWIDLRRKDIEKDDILHPAHSDKKIDLRFDPNDPTVDIYEKKTAVSEQLDAFVEEFAKEKKEAYGVNFIDPKTGERRPVVTFVGRFDPQQKGLEQLRATMAAAKAQGAVFVVVGDEPSGDATAEALLDELERQAKADKPDDDAPSWGGALILRDSKARDGYYKWQQGTVHQGSVRQDETEAKPGIGALLRAATDFGLIPSKYEPCGLVQMEHYLMGAMAIAMDVGGLHDTVFEKAEAEDAHHPAPTWTGYRIPRYHQFDFASEEQTAQTFKTVEAALRDWKKLDDKEKGEALRKVMLHGNHVSWADSHFAKDDEALKTPADKHDKSAIRHLERFFAAARVSARNRSMKLGVPSHLLLAREEPPPPVARPDWMVPPHLQGIVAG